MQEYSREHRKNALPPHKFTVFSLEAGKMGRWWLLTIYNKWHQTTLNTLHYYTSQTVKKKKDEKSRCFNWYDSKWNQA